MLCVKVMLQGRQRVREGKSWAEAVRVRACGWERRREGVSEPWRILFNDMKICPAHSPSPKRPLHLPHIRLSLAHITLGTVASAQKYAAN